MEAEEAIRKAYDLGFYDGLSACKACDPVGPRRSRIGIIREAQARRSTIWPYKLPNEKEVREWKT